MDPDVTDPLSTQTQYPSTNATSAVTVASPALHNYSTVSNHPGIALSTHHHSHLPEPPGYGTSQWYGATTNHPRPSFAPFGMPRMLSYPRYPNASGHGMPQGYPTAYGSQYLEPRYLPPGVVPLTYGYVPYNPPDNHYPQTDPYPDMNTMGYLPQRPVFNTLYGNVANVHNPPYNPRLTELAQFRGQSSEWPINASRAHHPPPQRETIPPTVAIDSRQAMPIPNELRYTTYEYTPPYRPLYGNEVHVNPSQFIPRPTTPLQFQGQSSEWPINTSQAPPIQIEVIPPAVAIDTNLACAISASSIQSSDFSSPQINFDCQSDEGILVTNQVNVLPTTPIASQHNDSSVMSSPAAKRLRLTDSLEQPAGPSQSAVTTPSSSSQHYSHGTTERCSQLPDPSEENFAFVYERLHSICSKWQNLGLALGLPTSTLSQISIDKREKCEDCLRESLLKLLQSRHLTWKEIIKTLRKPTINENELAAEIESEVVAIDSPTQQAPNHFSGKISLEELCLLPVDKVWYQLGLWLGVEEQRLIKIKKKDERKKLLFGAFLELRYESADYKRLCKRFPDDQKEKARRLLESEKYEDFISVFPQNKRVDARKLVEMSKSLFPRLITALVKVGNREMAEDITSHRGVLLTNLLNHTDSKPPPEVVMYADYLKSKYKNMSILPDSDHGWLPSIANKEHYTNLALIQTDNNLQTEEDINNVSEDYAHGNIDRIIAKKTNIDLEEAFYPIINPKTNESRLTILMDGAPGVGKTTITRKVCIDWAEGDVLPEYQLVILIPLRELKILQKLDKKLSLSDILRCDSKELQQNIEKHIMEVSGAGTLIIFDGFDELSFQERNCLQQSLVLDIIKGSKFHRCSVMITSRPYASQPLRSLATVNRHIEVLGFTEKQIHDCVCTNIPGKDGKKLIRELKERLDIGSLCYIPLNCRILLFVYKIKGFNLPSTITELYEIFLLHTIKRFAQFKKVTLDEDAFSEIISANNLKELPRVITVQLNALSKFALDGIKQSKLVFDDKSLNDYVSLGLLNSLHCFITTGETTFFQFLHLTIQEFLAARYVASDAMTDEGRKSFLRSNIKNETYRMTLLFLAGLTGFSFLSSGDSLLQSQSTFLSGSSKKERILMLAQIIYESKSSSDCILFHLNGSLDMSGYHLTKFDCLVLAHLISNTPRDFVWEIIDLSNCGITIPTYSVLLETKHSKHTMLPGIAVSKTLSFYYEINNGKTNSTIPFASIVTLLSSFKNSSPIEELALPMMNFQTCEGIVQLSQALINVKAFRTLKIGHYYSARQKSQLHKCTMISEEDFVLQCIPLSICSNSLMQLLKFASVEIERLEIYSRYLNISAVAFRDCSTCGTLGEDAVKSLCEFLRKCKNIEQVKFNECCLNGCRMMSIVSSLSESLISEIHFKKKYFEEDSEICDTELVQMLQCLPRKCTIYLKSKRVSIVFKTNQNDLDVSNHADSEALGYETFLTNIKCVFPQRFTGLSVEVKDTNETLLEYLSQNPNLKMITLITLPQGRVVVRTETSNRMILKLSKSLTSITIKAHNYSDILELVAEGVRQNNTLLCMEILCIYHSSYNPSDTITGLITLLNSLKSTPVQRLCFQNVLFDSVCTEAFIQLLSHNQNITDLAIKGSTYFTDSSCTPSSPNTWTFFRSLQMKSLTVLSVSQNKLETEALLDFLRLNPQLAVLEASNCNLTDNLFTDTHYNWETSSLKELTIDRNKDIGWTNLLQSLRYNTSLIKLKCYCHVDISEMIISNKSIQYLTTSKYPSEGQYNTKSLARALIQNLTLKEIKYGKGENVYDLKREIQKLKRDKNITISPEWNLKIRAAD